VACSTVMRKSNKWDCNEVLRSESRQKELSQHERSKRTYEKVNERYWETEILESRQESRQKNGIGLKTSLIS
jgi:hypothetical protein